MITNKFELIKTDTKTWNGRTAYRIKALVAIGSFVAAGEMGGYIESAEILSHSGDAWVSGDAQVYGNARVSGDARVSGNAQIIWFSKVGSENGTLTVAKSKEGLFVSRGCFSGTDIEFLSAVEKKHGKESKIGKEYFMLIEVARSRISE